MTGIFDDEGVKRGNEEKRGELDVETNTPTKKGGMEGWSTKEIGRRRRRKEGQRPE